MQQLQNAVTNAPVLMMSDFSQPFCIECDVSGTGLGAVLSQNKKTYSIFQQGVSGDFVGKIYIREGINDLGISNSALAALCDRQEIYGLHGSEES